MAAEHTLAAARADPTYPRVLSYTLVDGFTRFRGHAALAVLAAAVAVAGGFVIDFDVFGQGARVDAELEAGALGALCVALEAAGVHLYDTAELRKARGRRRVVALLHVAFA
jgi:hypothetical protein